MHDPVAWTGAWVTQMLKGHLNYYAVPGNDPSLRWFVAAHRAFLTYLNRFVPVAC